MFYEFQFGLPHQTCLSAIILKQLTIDSFVLTKTPGIIIDNDTTGAFDRVINGSVLIALRILGFSLTVTRMLGLTWRKRKYYVKTGLGISKQYYKSPPPSKYVALALALAKARLLHPKSGVLL
jgi:hypothetical protein